MKMNDFITNGKALWASDKELDLVISFLDNDGSTYFLCTDRRNDIDSDFEEALEHEIKETKGGYIGYSKIMENIIGKQLGEEKDFDYYQISINPRGDKENYIIKTVIDRTKSRILYPDD